MWLFIILFTACRCTAFVYQYFSACTCTLHFVVWNVFTLTVHAPQTHACRLVAMIKLGRFGLTRMPPKRPPYQTATTIPLIHSENCSWFDRGVQTVCCLRLSNTFQSPWGSNMLRVLSWTWRKCGRSLTSEFRWYVSSPWGPIPPTVLNRSPRNTISVSVTCMYMVDTMRVVYTVLYLE